MSDLDERLLRSRPASAGSFNNASSRALPFGRHPFQGTDVLGPKMRSQGPRSWIRVDSRGYSKMIEADKFKIMRRCELSARDMRLLDPMFIYPSKILGREKAIVVNLEQIRCIIRADEVLLLNSLDSYVVHYVVELQHRIAPARPGDNFESNRSGFSIMGESRDLRRSPVSTRPDNFPFEFQALEVALEAACTFLDTQAADLEGEAYSLLDELMSNISTSNLERVRRLKSRLLELTRRVQKVRGEIEHLMHDDGDMAEMYLTEKKAKRESAFYGDEFSPRLRSLDGARSFSAPISPVSSPYQCRIHEKKPRRARRLKETIRSSESTAPRTEELEMLLEAHSVVINGTLNKLTSLKEHIDNTEAFINIQLDNERNQVIQFQLLLTTATFAVTMITAVAATFGMNIWIPLYNHADVFKWVVMISLTCAVIVFSAFLWFYKYRKVVRL